MFGGGGSLGYYVRKTSWDSRLKTSFSGPMKKSEAKKEQIPFQQEGSQALDFISFTRIAHF